MVPMVPRASDSAVAVDVCWAAPSVVLCVSVVFLAPASNARRGVRIRTRHHGDREDHGEGNNLADPQDSHFLCSGFSSGESSWPLAHCCTPTKFSRICRRFRCKSASLVAQTFRKVAIIARKTAMIVTLRNVSSLRNREICRSWVKQRASVDSGDCCSDDSKSQRYDQAPQTASLLSPSPPRDPNSSWYVIIPPPSPNQSQSPCEPCSAPVLGGAGKAVLTSRASF